MKFDELPYEEQESVVRYLLGPVLTTLSYGALFGEHNTDSRNSSKSRCKRQGKMPHVVGLAVEKLLMSVDPVSIKDGSLETIDFEKILEAAVNYLSDGEVSLCDGISKAAETIVLLSKRDSRDGDFSFKVISALWGGIGDLIEASKEISIEDMESISQKINEVKSSCRCLSPGEIDFVCNALLSRMGEVWKASLKNAIGVRRALDIYARISGETISRESQAEFMRAIELQKARKKTTPLKHLRELVR